MGDNETNDNFSEYIDYRNVVYLFIYYIFFYICLRNDYDKSHLKDRLDEPDHYYNLLFSQFGNSLIIKDSKSLIFAESSEDIYILKFVPGYFTKKKKIGVILYDQFKFRVSLFHFLGNRSYLDYLREYTYNEYLSSTKDL